MLPPGIPSGSCCVYWKLTSFWHAQDMDRKCSPRGFSIVELAIVLVIVGLLVGGVLASREIVSHSRLTSTIVQASGYGAATGLFVDRYGGLPGDLKSAGQRIPGCSVAAAACQPPISAPTTGDGVVGDVGAIGQHQTSGLSPAQLETLLFWSHLSLSDLITL